MPHLSARGIVVSPLPDLLASGNRTSSHALHDEEFVGIEEDWAGLFSDVMRYFASIPSRKYDRVISYGPGPNAAATIFVEHVPTGMKAPCKVASFSVLANIWQLARQSVSTGSWQIISHPLISLCPVCQMWLFLQERVRCWLWERSRLGGSLSMISGGKIQQDSNWKRLLGQVAKYMKKAGTRYGFLSSYHKTVFLRQGFV